MRQSRENFSTTLKSDKTEAVGVFIREMFYDLARRWPQIVVKLLNDSNFSLIYSSSNGSKNEFHSCSALYKGFGEVYINHLPADILGKVEFYRSVIEAWDDLSVPEVYIGGFDDNTTICQYKTDSFIKQNKEKLSESLQAAEVKLKNLSKRPRFNLYKEAYWRSLTCVLDAKEIEEKEQLKKYLINAVSFYIENTQTEEILAIEDPAVHSLVKSFTAEHFFSEPSMN